MYEVLGSYNTDDWMSKKWPKQVIRKGINGSKEVLYNQKYLELSIMCIVKQESIHMLLASSELVHVPYRLASRVDSNDRFREIEEKQQSNRDVPFINFAFNWISSHQSNRWSSCLSQYHASFDFVR